MNALIKPALLCFLLAACGSDPPPPVADVRAVRAERVSLATTTDDVRYPGEIRARHETDLAFRVAGRVNSRAVDAGSVVRSGQLVATLDADDYALVARAARSQLAAAEAEARLAEADLQRFSELRAKNFIAEAELDRRRAAAEASLAQVRALRADAARQGNQATYARLTAPAAGVVTAVLVEAGQVVAAGQPVVRLALAGEREVRIDVPENALDALRRAPALKVRLWSSPDRVYAARLRELAPMADPATRTYAARVALIDADAAVRLGMTATVEQETAAAAVLAVAASALFKINGRPQVWVVDPASGAVAARAVELGALTGERVTVRAGLAAGEWVVTAGVHKLAPGQRVRLVK
ncbi:MAG: efflux transporter periplasmic adaptor subunit [Hydrogenophilales bacterium 16-64-46]|nr:MAG: efflux transporter periplasmic adaptor subunit [Hydrogenophilales bacterium 12-64-13]OYZ05330.1 MAG: efflux transporter periplasmic adaptor subunit [Hydrogenophilales bacterium 16-64-46]OZA37144.1 MAG: efflux transporter periplasmic adaptor subunit [Hydrogenophilales bacterium 17-64-34]HQS99373.1 efflux RND transporter periplasmic adaptor subunit [Thiobacillus sp.]